MYKVVVFAPVSHSKEVKDAMFKAGGGRIGDYDCCSFEVEGTGQFRPLKGSNPYIGNEGEIQKVKELRVEMVCENSCIEEVKRAMLEAHPYETPAYDIIPLADI